MAHSIKGRLLLGLVIPILIAIIGGSLAIYSLFKESLYAEMDHFLSEKVRFHRLALFQNDKHVSFNMDPGRWKALHDTEHPEYYHFRYNRSGRLIMKSPMLSEEGLPRIGKDSDTAVFRNIDLPAGIPGRAIGLSFFPEEVRGDAEPKRLHLVIAEDASRIMAALKRLRLILTIVSCAAAFLVLFSAARIVHRNMRPLDDLSRQIEDVPIAAESGRFELADAPAELNPVVTRMNALMDRVSLAIEKERQFTANAAHELRNPLAGIRSQLELALSQDRSADEYQVTIGEVLKNERRLEVLVENLLLLSKLEAGQEDTGSETVSLPDLLRKSWKPCFDAAEQKQLAVQWDVDAGANGDLVTSSHLFQIILSNMFQNAVTHAPEKDIIRIAASHDDDTVCVTVANRAPDLSAEDIPQIFERFWRANAARELTNDNVGIGLSICQRITSTLGGTIDATLDDQKNFALKVCIPAQKV